MMISVEPVRCLTRHEAFLDRDVARRKWKFGLSIGYSIPRGFYRLGIYRRSGQKVISRISHHAHTFSFCLYFIHVDSLPVRYLFLVICYSLLVKRIKPDTVIWCDIVVETNGSHSSLAAPGEGEWRSSVIKYAMIYKRRYTRVRSSVIYIYIPE